MAIRPHLSHLATNCIVYMYLHYLYVCRILKYFTRWAIWLGSIQFRILEHFTRCAIWLGSIQFRILEHFTR